MSGPSAEGPVDRPDIVAFIRARLDEDEAYYSTLLDAIQQHLPRQARYLREVEAKRRIVGLVEDCPHPPRTGGWCLDCDRFLRFVAAIFQAHPDYDPAWRPS